MAFRIEIGLRRGVRDPRGAAVVARAREYLHLNLRGCATRDVYLVDADLPAAERRRIRDAFADPVVARAALDRLPPPPFDWLVEVAFKPGVTDNVGHTARAVLADVLEPASGEAAPGVYTSVQYFLRGDLDRAAAERLAREALANPLIQTISIYSAAEWRACPPPVAPPVVRGPTAITVRTYDLSGSDEELLRISRDGILSLSLEEMRAIRDHFRRAEVVAARAALGMEPDPTDVELECIAQTWSEHCKHKIFAARIRYTDEHGRTEIVDSLFDTCIRAATRRIAENGCDWLVSVFKDNAGIVRFNDRWNLAYKVETHNSPSALDPYGGAITGIVGVNRDPMGTGMGCEMLCNVWGYCLGSPFYDGDLPAGLMHPRRIRDGVHQGVIDGGNQSGIPWARGFERFDERYIGKPLVYCGTLGRIPAQVGGRPSERKEIRPGDAIVMCGGRIGKDGIHGATFSSEELREESPAQAVQIGDPITQRKMYEFLMEARDLGLYRALTDNGAGGLSSSIGELCTLSGGADLDLTPAPLKYAGLQPWEILLSEAQERMSLAVPPERLEAFLALARRRDVEATALGEFTNSGRFIVRYGDRIVAALDLEFLHHGCPRLELEARWTPPAVPAPRRPRAGNRTAALKRLLSRLNICSKEYKSRQYDGEVKGLSVVKPFVGARCDTPSDATVLRVDLGADDGVVLAEGIQPSLSDLDTAAMMETVIDEAVRRIISAGGEWGTIAGLDNFCWPDPVLSEKTPDGPYKLAQLVRANRALHDLCVAYGVPCISGKDSMKNDSVRGGRKISIPPTALFSTIGRIGDVRRALTMPFQREGDWIAIVGRTRDERGGSEYHRMLAEAQGTPDRFGGEPPRARPAEAAPLYRAMDAAIRRGLLRSSHTPTLGGLAVAFALCCIGGACGADIDLAAAPQEGDLDDDALLFSESNSRFVVTYGPERAVEIERAFEGMPFARVGRVGAASAPLTVRGRRGALIAADPEELRRAFRDPLWGV